MNILVLVSMSLETLLEELFSSQYEKLNKFYEFDYFYNNFHCRERQFWFIPFIGNFIYKKLCYCHSKSIDISNDLYLVNKYKLYNKDIIIINMLFNRTLDELDKLIENW